MNLAQLQALAASVGFPDPALAAAVAMAESGGNPAASCINCLQVTERSFGLWQINTLAHPQYDEARLLDPTYNAQAAFAVSSKGTNWGPWSAFTRGGYREYYVPPSGGNGWKILGFTAAVSVGALATVWALDEIGKR